MKNRIIYIILIIVFSVLTLFVWKIININNKSNGFNRKFIGLKTRINHTMELPSASYGFTGKLDSNITLSSYKEKLNLYKIDFSLTKLDTINIKYNTQFNTSTNIYKDLRHPNYYFSNPFGNISSYKDSMSLYSLVGLRIDNFKAVSPLTIIARARHNYGEEKNRAIVKLNLSKDVILQKIYGLPQHVSGFYANDGWLTYDEKKSMIFYMYYYRGEVLSLDTNLNLLYKAKTIDTVNVTDIKIGIMRSRASNGKLRTKTTPRSPLSFVNTYITTDNNHIYILSRLKADNESRSNFSENQVVDVYNIENGIYLYSLYIPKYKGNKLNEIQFKKDLVIAIYGKYLVSYTLITK